MVAGVGEHTRAALYVGLAGTPVQVWGQLALYM